MNSKIKFIFFDVGNTLLFPNRDRIHVPLTDRGLNPDATLLRNLERSTKNQFDQRMAEDNGTNHSFWWMFYSQLLAQIKLNDEGVRDQLVSNIQQSANWDVIRPGTREQLQQLGARYKIGVISNADGKIEDVLARCNIADCFRTITDSGLVGVEKPHPEIFRQALQAMVADPAESLYVGDMYSVDYVGATGAGMQAVLMDVPGAYLERGVARVDSMEELQAALQSNDRA